MNNYAFQKCKQLIGNSPAASHCYTSKNVNDSCNNINALLLINCTLSKEISWDINFADKYSLEVTIWNYLLFPIYTNYPVLVI